MVLRRAIPAETESIGSLFSRLKEDGIRFARAEAEYYKQLGLTRFNGIRTALILVVVAIFLVQSALTTMLIGIGMALASWLGAAGGVLAAALLGFAIAGLLAWLAVRRFSAPSAVPAAIAEHGR